MLTLFILAGITGVVVYIIFHDVAPVPGVMSSLYRKNLTPQDIRCFKRIHRLLEVLAVPAPALDLWEPL